MMRSLVITLILCLGFSFKTIGQTIPQPIIQPAPQLNSPTKKQNPDRVLFQKKSDTNIKIGGEIDHYRYVESGLVEHVGFMFGGWGDYQQRLSFATLSVNSNLTYGKIDYNGSICNTLNVCQPYRAKTVDIISKSNAELHFKFNDFVTGQIGLGFRYLFDNGEGVGFYQRTGMWFYMPVGLIFEFELLRTKSFIEFEYDSILSGGMKSNLSEARPNMSDVYHEQSGRGVLVSVGGEIYKDVKLSSYYQSWDLDESVLISDGNSLTEPANNSTVIGLRLGLNFDL